jgi:hypothetical protein
MVGLSIFVELLSRKNWNNGKDYHKILRSLNLLMNKKYVLGMTTLWPIVHTRGIDGGLCEKHLGISDPSQY